MARATVQSAAMGHRFVGENPRISTPLPCSIYSAPPSRKQVAGPTVLVTAPFRETRKHGSIPPLLASPPLHRSLHVLIFFFTGPFYDFSVFRTWTMSVLPVLREVLIVIHPSSSSTDFEFKLSGFLTHPLPCSSNDKIWLNAFPVPRMKPMA